MTLSKYISLVFILGIALMSCGKQKSGNEAEATASMNLDPQTLQSRIEAYAPVHISSDLSHLTDRQRLLIGKLAEAGHLADEIFWKQSAPDAAAIRDSLRDASSENAQLYLKYILINYGPYDRIYEGRRFVGSGPAEKPAGAGFYPLDMSKEEFETYVQSHPDRKAELESQYTIVVRDGDDLRGVPFHEAYPEVEAIAQKLEEAAGYADNPSLKKYLALRAQALRTDDYYASDMAWMDLEGNDIDVVIGPIEHYEDALFNLKTAFECAVMVKDEEGTRELEMFKQHIDDFEHALPEDPKYIRASAGMGNVLEVVNIVYFGGDFQAGIKTIAASLPNDPRVTQVKGGKKQMYKNLMEAKFETIVKPIAKIILDPALLPHVNRKAFTSFVTLHEVSHTLGRGYVYGNDSLSVRKALKERYSAIEECKADVLGLYNNRLLLSKGLVTEAFILQSFSTYVAGLFRSLRFGADEAHGKANLVQLNFLREKGAIQRTANDQYTLDRVSFFDALAELARELLTIEAEGDYERAGKFLDRYGIMNDEIEGVIHTLRSIPRDIDTSYDF